MRVLVMGLGYVGLPLAVRAAEVGHCVIGIDVDPAKVAALQEGVSYVEDVSDARLGEVLARGSFEPRSDGSFCAERSWTAPSSSVRERCAFDLALIAVPTPLRGQQPDLSYVESAATMLGQLLRRGAAVVLESTSYPGTTERVVGPILERESGLGAGVDFHLGFSPERIDPGPSPYTLENTPKLVSATTPAGLSVIGDFYASIVEETVPVSSPAVAEMAKVFENTQAYVNIGLVNEMADICAELGIDIYEMIDAAMTKGHSMAYWVPGPGVGGHCLPVDPLYLAWQTEAELGRPFRFGRLAEEINNGRPHHVVERVRDLLNDAERSVRGSKVLLLGVAYKAGVGDLRESSALPIVSDLQRLGAQVTVCDPHVNGQWRQTPSLPLEEVYADMEDYDLVLLHTDHDGFDFEKVGLRARQVLDCRRRVPAGLNVTHM